MSPQLESARVQIIRGLTQSGIPRDEALLTAEVALHAAEEAIETLTRVCEPLQCRAWTNGYAIALQVTTAMLGGLQTQFQEKADALGMGTRNFTVDTRQ